MLSGLLGPYLSNARAIVEPKPEAAWMGPRRSPVLAGAKIVIRPLARSFQ